MENKKNIAVVIPTIRPKDLENFLVSWKYLFDRHNIELIVVNDTQDKPFIETKYLSDFKSNSKYGWYDNNWKELISNKCAGVRQLGFKFIAENLPNIEYIFTTDDDCFPATYPFNDPIQDHIDQLNRRVPISWISTSTDMYMRGFPYQVREEAPVMLSHGVWTNVPDYDAPTQLLTPKDFKPTYYKGVIPKGIFAPICGMNVMFRRELLKYVYFSPVGTFKGAERFDDIFLGVLLIPKMAELNYAIVTGYAMVKHLRASNVFTSLEKESVGIRHNEEFWKNPQGYDGDPFFKKFRENTKKWYNLVSGFENKQSNVK